MADFEVRMDGYRYRGVYIRTYYGYDKNSIIKAVKLDAQDDDADEFHIYYKGSMKSIGSWEKKGSRWYKTWPK